jgi:hypothetical protein
MFLPVCPLINKCIHHDYVNSYGWSVWLRFTPEIFEHFLFPFTVVRMSLGRAHRQRHLRQSERKAIFPLINIYTNTCHNSTNIANCKKLQNEQFCLLGYKAK